MKNCFMGLHLYVSGFGAHFGADGLVCACCGLSKYPEVAPGYLVAKILGRVIEKDDDDYNYWADQAHEARRARRAAEAE